MKSLKSLKKELKPIVKQNKKHFAAGGGKEIDYNLKEFDVAFVGGLQCANVLKYLQHMQFKGTMAGWTSRGKFFNEHHYEYLIHGNMQAYKYLAMAFNSNYDVKQSAYFNSRVVDINPSQNTITDEKGQTYSYKALVLNTGLDQRVQHMPFVNQHVQDGELGHSRVFVHNPSDVDHQDRNRRIFGMHKDNDFIVYLPRYPSRREAYDAWYLGLDTYLSWGVHSQANPYGMKIRVITPNDNLFRFPFANEVVMEEISQREMIETHFGWEITNVEVVNKSVNSVMRYATFKNVNTGEEMRLPFGTLLLTPENHKRECYSNNDLADKDGQVTVNPYTMQHTKYPNVFAFGDCANVDTTKSFYATLNQGVVLRNNLHSYLEGRDFNAVYEGYSSFAVNHSIDRQWIFSHYYNYKPSFGNFYVPRFFGLFAYKFKNSLEKQYFSKVFQSKPNYGYPWLQKNRYFRPLEENRFMKQNGLKREDIMIHSAQPPVLSFHQH